MAYCEDDKGRKQMSTNEAITELRRLGFKILPIKRAGYVLFNAPNAPSYTGKANAVDLLAEVRKDSGESR